MQKEFVPVSRTSAVDPIKEPFSDAKNSCSSTFNDSLKAFVKLIVKSAIKLPALKDNTVQYL